MILSLLVVATGKHYVLCAVRSEFRATKDSTVYPLVHPSFADAHTVSCGRYLTVEFVSLEFREPESVMRT
jgi:hypothetical protein